MLSINTFVWENRIVAGFASSCLITLAMKNRAASNEKIKHIKVEIFLSLADT